ncbi:MAG TPA: M61 family peptidase, partial [Thermoanaerobaculia bacterium]
MLNYVLSWAQPFDRLFDVSISFVAPVDDPRLVLPSWRPGRYLIQNFAANVREWSAGEHRIRKDGKSSWRVAARAAEPVTVRYRYYAGVLDAGSSFLDADEAYFNGSNLFMLVEGLRGEEHRLTIAAPADWMIETQLPRARDDADDGGATFLARDYDHLIDSPTICSPKLTRHTFSESGTTIHLVFRGDEGIDTAQYVEPVRAVVREQAALMGGMPLTEYRFLYHVRDKWHGVEHEASSSIIVRRGALIGVGPGDDGYDHLLSITSHELFHLWNVKRILPAAFAPYDYSTETPTRLLWAMEGITSYYGELTLVRCGKWKLKRYLDHLRKEIETLESLPARRHVSLSDVSFDAWLADAFHMHDRGNATYSFYTKGELVSLLLDLTIRTRSEGTKSLDDVMRLLWNEYGAAGRGLEEDAIERAVARVCDVGDFFA